MRSFLSFGVAVRVEWHRLVRSRVAWLYIGIVAALGAVAGLKGSETLDPVFGPIKISMMLSLMTALWTWHATTEVTGGTLRELHAARVLDEWAAHSGRVLTVGLTGGLLSVLFWMTFNISRLDLLVYWADVVKWLPHVILGHGVAAAIGGLVGLVLRQWQGLGLLGSVVIWSVLQFILDLTGTGSPDFMLRYIAWSRIYHDGVAEPYYITLLTGLAGTMLVTVIIGMLLFRLASRSDLAPPALHTSASIGLVGAAVLLLVLWVTSYVAVHKRESLFALPQPLIEPRATITWDPNDQELQIGVGERVTQNLQGPVLGYLGLDIDGLPAYVGRHGVTLPMSSLVAGGTYELKVIHPPGWRLYGCLWREPLPEGGTVCGGDSPELDWLIILPDQEVARASQNTEVTEPARAAAQDLFQDQISAVFLRLGEPSPEVVFLGGHGLAWIGPRTVKGPDLFGNTAGGKQRQAVYMAALATAQYLSGQKNLPSGPRLHRLPELGRSDVPTAFLATIDRLMFELDGPKINSAERDLRAGRHPDMIQLQDWSLPQITVPKFNRWWTEVDRLLTTGKTTPEDLWTALAGVRNLQSAKDWEAVAEVRWHLNVDHK